MILYVGGARGMEELAHALQYRGAGPRILRAGAPTTDVALRGVREPILILRDSGWGIENDYETDNIARALELNRRNGHVFPDMTGIQS